MGETPRPNTQLTRLPPIHDTHGVRCRAPRRAGAAAAAAAAGAAGAADAAAAGASAVLMWQQLQVSMFSPSCPAHRSCQTRAQSTQRVPPFLGTNPLLITQFAFGHLRGHALLSSAARATAYPTPTRYALALE
jgi:hypothetical protein